MRVRRAPHGPLAATAALAVTLATAAGVTAAAPDFAWIRQFGTSEADDGLAAAVDAARNIYVVGCTSGALPGQTNKGGEDAFVRKLRPGGGTAWTRQFGTDASDCAYWVAIDGHGRVVVVGQTAGALPGQTNKGGVDAFVRVLRPDGSSAWTRQFGGDGNERSTSVAIDGADRIAVVGWTSGALPGQTNRGGFDAFVRVFRASGRHAWTRQPGTAADDFADSGAIDGRDRISVAGTTEGALLGQTNEGGRDSFVRVLRPNGAQAWTRQFGTDQAEYTTSVAIDSRDRIIVAGETEGALPGQTNEGEADAFVRVLRPTGGHAWTREFGTDQWDTPNSVAIDGDDRIIVAGQTLGALPGQTHEGGHDAFVRVLRPSGGHAWTRQFGTAANDAASSVAIDGRERIAVAGYTAGALPGQTNHGGRDAFALTFQR